MSNNAVVPVVKVQQVQPALATAHVKLLVHALVPFIPIGRDILLTLILQSTVGRDHF